MEYYSDDNPLSFRGAFPKQLSEVINADAFR